MTETTDGSRHEPTERELDAPIKAKPLPHPGRWIGHGGLVERGGHALTPSTNSGTRSSSSCA